MNELPEKSHLEGYLALFQQLTPDTVDQFELWVTPDIHFRDPFNDVVGKERMIAIMHDMFERTEDPRFFVKEYQCHHNVAYVRWQFTAKVPVLGFLDVDGMSRVTLAEDGRVSEHLDYWDSAPVYLRLPLLGAILRRIRARMALP